MFARLFATRRFLAVFLLPALLLAVSCSDRTPPPPPPNPKQVNTPPPPPAPAEPFRVVGVHPLPGTPLDREMVFYFNRPPAPLPEGTDTASLVSIYPPLPLSSARVQGNALVVSFSREHFLKNLAFLNVVLSKDLAAADGAPLAKEVAQHQFMVDPKGGKLSAMDIKVLPDRAFMYRIALPALHAIVQTHYDIQLLDRENQPLKEPDGGSIKTSWDTDGTGAQILQFQLPADANYPARLLLTRNEAKNDQLDAFLAREYSINVPGKELQVTYVVWRKDNLGREFIDLKLNSNVPPKTLLERAKLFLVSDNQEITFTMDPGENSVTPSSNFSISPMINDLPDDAVFRLEITPPLIGANGGAALPEPFIRTVKRITREEQERQSRQRNNESIASYWQNWNDGGLKGPQYSMYMNCSIDLDAFRQALSVAPEVDNLTVTSQGRNFVLEGAWRAGKVYTVRLEAGLASTDGSQKLDNPMVFATEPAPKFEYAGFDLKGRCYIPGSQFGPLTLKTRNITEAKLGLYRVFPSNIPRAVMEMDGSVPGWEFNQNLSELMADHNVTVRDMPDTLQETSLDIAALLPADRRGVFTISSSPNSRWDGNQLMLWTNLGVIAHWKSDEVLVFVHDLHTLAPVSGASVSVWSSKCQNMGTIATDRDGIALFSALETRFGAPVVLVVETQTDATFLKLQHREQDTPQVSASLTPFNFDGYDAHLHLDRNLYRPGETVHARWIVRTRLTEAAANVPLLFRLENPKGRLIQSTPVTLSEIGTGGLDIVTERSHLTGKYTAELRVPGESAPIGTAVFNLEEFVPNRMKAAVALDSALITPEKPAAVTITAENLYGGAAVGRTAEALVILRPGKYEPEQWPGYTFTNDTALEPMLEKLGQKKTDEAGSASFEFTYTARETVTMPLEASVRGMVFELGGREVRARAEAVVFPAPVALGLALASAPGEVSGLDVSVAAIQADQSPAALEKVFVTLDRESWTYNVRRMEGGNQPWYIRSYAPVQTVEVPLENGRGATRFTVGESWCRYRVRVHSPETPMFATSSFFSRWDRIELKAPSSPSLIQLSVNNELHNPGDTCELHIRSPYDGVAFVAAQNDRFRKAWTVPVVNGEAMLSFTVTRDHFPNCWLEVTVVRKSDKDPVQAHPFSSFAMAQIRVNDVSNRLTVALPNLPEEVRPAQRVEFAVETLDHKGNPVAAEVTLAAVDEGIHTILDFANPDPFSWFQRARLPQFNYAHYYDKIAYDFTPANVGGDAIEKRLGGAPQVGENWIKPVALWSGALRTDENGRAVAAFDVPEFNGQLRLVAVAATANAAGAAAGSVFVRRPHILETGMPRFALPGDTFSCGATVINTTQEACRAVLRWRAEGTLSGAGEHPLELGPGASGSIRAEFTAAAMGQGKIIWEADIFAPSGGDPIERLAQEAPLPVRPPAAWQSEVRQYVLNAGESLVFNNATLAGDNNLEHSLAVSANPLNRLRRNLAYLVHYPHGCVEQVTSQSMPLLLLRRHTDLFKGLLPGNEAGLDAMIKGYISGGVSKLLSMQTPSGGLGTWPGASYPYTYGSIYAAHFLTLVRAENAAEVPEKAFRSLQDFLRQIMNGHGGVNYEYERLYTRAYALYVLALDGQLDAVEAIPRFDRIEMPEPGRWLLAAALARNVNDPKRVEEYLKKAPSKAYLDRYDSGDLNSEIRSVAVRLLAGVQMGLSDESLQPQVNQLVEWVDKNLGYYNTQEAAFVITAMSAYLSRMETDVTAASAQITHPEGVENLQGGGTWTGTAEGSGKNFEVANTGAVPIFVTHTCMGIPTTPRTVPVSEGISLTRGMTREDGSPVIAGEALAHGAGYLVELTIEVPTARENVVISDLLPAGLEIANPRLDKDAVAAMGKGKAEKAEDRPENGEEEDDDGNVKDNGLTPAYLEARDDRLVLAFDALKPGTHRFYYAVRAVTPGTFQQPALQGECMYNPAIRAATVDGAVTIK